LAGRDWLQQLCLVNIDYCRNVQETFILFYFISHVFYFSGSELVKYNKMKLTAKNDVISHLILFYVGCADGLTDIRTPGHSVRRAMRAATRGKKAIRGRMIRSAF